MNKIVPYTPNRPRSSPYYQTAQPPPPNELRIVRSRDQQGYELFEIDIGDYDQRDVSVQVHSDNHLAIHAVHYFNYLDKFNYVRKELLRTFELPANANHEYISSSLSHDGILSIHVPLRLPVPPYDPQPMDTMAVPFRSTGHSNNTNVRN